MVVIDMDSKNQLKVGFYHPGVKLKKKWYIFYLFHSILQLMHEKRNGEGKNYAKNVMS